jgi:predicted SAM-dependent methyltransferase
MKSEPVKLHLGCGKVFLPGYINVDILQRPGVDVVADLRNLPFDQNSVQMIYSCAAIEHFGRKEWLPLIEYWHSLLVPNGLLRISTMDFEACCAQYQKSGNLGELLGLLIGGQKDEYDWHGMIFDYAILAEGLAKAGFKNIRRYDWRETDLGISGIDDFSQAYLPHMQKKTGRLMMLNVEANKAIAQDIPAVV